MLLSALDPALLIYSYEDWQARSRHCFRRYEALTLHRRVIRLYGQRIAMSSPFAGLVYQCFPWNGDYRGIKEFRDLRRFILEELQRAYYIDTRVGTEVDLQPNGIVCQYVEAPEVFDTWEELLCSCVDAAVLAEFDPQIATWETPALHDYSTPMILTIHDSEDRAGTSVHHLPLVWDDDSWATQLVAQEWWPDLQRCVELHFRTNPGMRDYPGVREQPIPFECTDAFWKSANRFCRDKQQRRSLIEALTKRMYGILDASLGDEPFGEVRRLRVTDFWRVHYREEDDRLVLEEFGSHSMGGVN